MIPARTTTAFLHFTGGYPLSTLSPFIIETNIGIIIETIGRIFLDIRYRVQRAFVRIFLLIPRLSQITLFTFHTVKVFLTTNCLNWSFIL